MRCDEVPSRLDAYVDAQLEPDVAADLESHATACRTCAALLDERRALSTAVRQSGGYRPASPALRASIVDSIRTQAEPARPARTPRWAWGSLAASIALLGALAWVLFAQARPLSLDRRILSEATSAHIRSLMLSHLADVTTSDQHTVKPWFAGKLDFSPRVVDHAAEGFPLAGGRLDYINNRPVAAVVYQRRAHTINLFTCPDPSSRTPFATTDRGYNAATWSDGQMRFCAVSDLNHDELMQFVSLIQADAKPSQP